jgi:hypothetical protein
MKAAKQYYARINAGAVHNRYVIWLCDSGYVAPSTLQVAGPAGLRDSRAIGSRDSGD